MRPLSALMLTMLSTQLFAAVPAAQQVEIEHLIGFVKSSDCLINRNGSLHKGEEAASHIIKKYHHFRDEVATTEAFVELSASKSTLSGKPYTVTCNQVELTTQQWLLDELQRYRKLQQPGVEHSVR